MICWIDPIIYRWSDSISMKVSSDLMASYVLTSEQLTRLLVLFDILEIIDFIWNLDESVLLRVINGGVAQELMFYVEGHNMTIVGADGDEVVPMAV